MDPTPNVDLLREALRSGLLVLSHPEALELAIDFRRSMGESAVTAQVFAVDDLVYMSTLVDGYETARLTSTSCTLTVRFRGDQPSEVAITPRGQPARVFVFDDDTKTSDVYAPPPVLDLAHVGGASPVAPPPPEPAAPEPLSPQPAAPEPPQPQPWRPTHIVGAHALEVGGVPAGTFTPGTVLDPGLGVSLLVTTSDGWALVECSNTWQCYVAAWGLVALDS